MGKRQENLEKLLEPLRVNRNKTHKLKTADFSESQLNEITKTYKALGGIREIPPINYGKYDIVINNFVVE